MCACNPSYSGELLEQFRRQRLLLGEIAPLHSSLNRVRLHLKIKSKLKEKKKLEGKEPGFVLGKPSGWEVEDLSAG